MLASAINIISRGWNNYRHNWRHFLPYMILLAVSGAIVFIAGYTGVEIELHLRANRLINDIVIFLIYIASLVFTLWVTIGLTQVVAAACKNQPFPSWKEVLATSNHLIIPIIINSVLVTLLIAVGSILFIVPGIIFFVWYNFTTYAIIIDGQTWKSSFSASKSLVVGRWWAIAWRIVVIIIFYAAVSVVIQYAFTTLTGLIHGISETTLEVVDNTFASLINILLTPLLVSSFVELYFNAKENPVNRIAPPTV